jgi:hypothetical protein
MGFQRPKAYFLLCSKGKTIVNNVGTEPAAEVPHVTWPVMLRVTGANSKKKGDTRQIKPKDHL